MQVVQIFNPNLGMTGTFTASTQVGSKMLIINESNVNLSLTFPNGATSYVPANDRRLYCLTGAMAQPHSVYTWTSQSFLTNANSINQVVVETYDPGEALNESYPSPLIRQTNLGSGLQNVIASQLINDTNAAGFQLVEGQVGGDSAGSAVVLTNDGNLALGNSVRTGSIDMPGGGATVSSLTAKQLITLPHGTITGLLTMSFISLTTTLTLYSHTLGAVPDIILLSPNGTSSTARTWQIDYTQVTATQFAAVGNSSFQAHVLLIKM